MTSPRLTNILEQIKTLTPEELRQLRENLDTPPAQPSEEERLDELDRRLLEAGLVSRIPPKITDFTPYQNRKLVEAKGKPVSETIIEERR
jgi:hypothetical protein